MPLRTASSRAASSSGSLSPEAWRTMSRPNSDPAAAVSSRRSVVAGARRESRWLTTSRTLSGVPSSASGRVGRMVPSTTSTIPVSTRARHSSQTRKALPPVSSPIARASSGWPWAGVAGGGVAQELVDVVVGEAGEAQPDDVVGTAQVGERLRERLRDVGLRVAEGDEQEHARVAGGAREVAQEQEGRRIGPMAVLDARAGPGGR